MIWQLTKEGGKKGAEDSRKQSMAILSQIMELISN